MLQRIVNLLSDESSRIALTRKTLKMTFCPLLYACGSKRHDFLGPVLEGKNSYRVHDLLLDFARGKLGDFIEVQIMFLESLRGQCMNGEWASFKGNKSYFFR